MAESAFGGSFYAMQFYTHATCIASPKPLVVQKKGQWFYRRKQQQ